MAMKEDEKILLLDCQQGNTQSFGPLYDRYIKDIYRFVYYRVHHKETAEDLTSTVFFKALDRINQCDPEKSFSAWLYQIARNTIIDHYRTRKKTMNIEDAWDIADDSDYDADIHLKSQLKEIKKHLSSLSAIQRNILIMRVWEEKSYREIAEIIEKSEDNCKVIFSRAVAELKKLVPISALIALFIN